MRYDKRQKVMIHRSDLKNLERHVGWQKLRDNAINGEFIVLWLTNAQINKLARNGIWVEQ